jgi:menaquinone-dependent protoporphyrinogen oxidase
MTLHVLVASASKHGSTTEIAAVIGDLLVERGLRVTVLPAGQVPDLAPYDAIVLGSAVYAGRWLDAARTLGERLAADGRSRPAWLFSSGPIGDPPKPLEPPTDAARMLTRTGAIEHRLFAGRLIRAQLGSLERLVTSALKAPDGDFRPWPEISSWADRIATTLQSRHSSAAAT